MYKVFGSPKTRAFRVIWMLNELGVPYEVDPAQPRDARITALNPSEKAMEVFSQRLGDRQFVMGDMFTVPDILMGHLCRWSVNMGWPLPEGNVTAYAARVCSRPAAVIAIAAASPKPS